MVATSVLRAKIGRQVEAATRHSGPIRVRNRLFAVCVVEVWAELSVLLAYLTPVELHGCIDLPKRLGCPASGRDRHPLPEIYCEGNELAK